MLMLEETMSEGCVAGNEAFFDETWDDLFASNDPCELAEEGGLTPIAALAMLLGLREPD